MSPLHNGLSDRNGEVSNLFLVFFFCLCICKVTIFFSLLQEFFQERRKKTGKKKKSQHFKG